MKIPALILVILLAIAPIPVRAASVQGDVDLNGALDIARGGTNAATAAQARTNLGLDSIYQPLATALTEIAALACTAGQVIKRDALGHWICAEDGGGEGGGGTWGSITGTLSEQLDLQSALDAKLGTTGNGSGLTGLTKSQVGLGNADNTSDVNKPISAATQSALDGKLGTTGNGSGLTGLTKSQVGLGNADNTSDANKPISSATQSALDAKAPSAGPAFTAFAGNSAEYDNGNSGTAKIIDWNNGNKQKIVLTGSPDCSITFTPPANQKAGNLLLRIEQGVGFKTVTWSSSPKWPGGTVPTLATTAAAIDIVNCYCTGGASPIYYCVANGDFK